MGGGTMRAAVQQASSNPLTMLSAAIDAESKSSALQ
jgi:hypothetical protein